MITSKDLFFLIERAEAGATRMTRYDKARLERIKTDAAKMEKAEGAEKCWLRRCNSPVAVRLDMGHQLHLCSAHGYELEENADEAGSYSNAAPAKGYRSHWPWKLPTA